MKKYLLKLLVIFIVSIVVFSYDMWKPYEEPDVQFNTPYIVEEITEDHILLRPVDNPVEDVDKPAYTEEELETLALIIYQEAGGDACSDDTRMKVGNTFLNRVESDLFPDTFYEVATAKRQYGRLYWTGLVWPERASLPEEQAAVQRAYDTAERLLEGERVLPENVIWQAEFVQGDGIHSEQDGFYFCYSEVKE